MSGTSMKDNNKTFHYLSSTPPMLSLNSHWRQSCNMMDLGAVELSDKQYLGGMAVFQFFLLESRNKMVAIHNPNHCFALRIREALSSPKRFPNIGLMNKLIELMIR